MGRQFAAAYFAGFIAGRETQPGRFELRAMTGRGAVIPTVALDGGSATIRCVQPATSGEAHLAGLPDKRAAQWRDHKGARGIGLGMGRIRDADDILGKLDQQVLKPAAGAGGSWRCRLQN